MSDLKRLLAALGAPPAEPATPAGPVADEPPLEPDDDGRPRPALTREQVTWLRRQRRLPLDVRPQVTELAARLGVDRRTVQRALYGAPPYDWGDPAPRRGSRHRTRGSQRFRD